MMRNQTKTEGHLELIMGPMFSGKTSKLIEVYNQYQLCDITPLVINYYEDTRYGHVSELYTHSKNVISCVPMKELSSLLNKDILDKYSVILINEGQFFQDLYDVVNKLVNTYHKHVYVAGLDGDFKRQGFKEIMKLIPESDTIHKLTALCMNCKDGTKALFTARLTKEIEQKVIGVENYRPLCRRCYNLLFDSLPPSLTPSTPI